MLSFVAVCFRSTFQSSKTFYLFILFNIYIFICSCIMCMPGVYRPGKDVGSPGIGVIAGCESPCVFLDLNPGSSDRGTCALIC